MLRQNTPSPESIETNIKVYLRLRNTSTNNTEEYISHNEHTLRIQTPTNKKQIQYFKFDKIFERQDQIELYNNILKDSLDYVLHGYNHTLFTYGQTSTGKTYTLGTGLNQLNDVNQNGLIYNFIKDLIVILKDRQFNLNISFIEIYNEKVIDLLSDDNIEIVIRQDKSGDIIWYNSTEYKIETLHDFIKCLNIGLLNRKTGKTDLNENSSRSHAVLRVSLELFCNNKIINSKFNFVDLAGSERIIKTGAVNHQLKEGIHINSGLLALGNVINALATKSKNKKVHVPYRDSKLTRLLQDSLGESNRIIMIACINNSRLDYHETMNTLNYATRAKKIQLKPNINNNIKLNDNYYEHIIDELKMEIAGLKDKLNQDNNNANIVHKELIVLEKENPTIYLLKRIKNQERELNHTKQKLTLLQRDYATLIQNNNNDKAMIKDNNELLIENQRLKQDCQTKDTLIQQLQQQIKADSTYQSLNNSSEEMEVLNFTNINMSSTTIHKFNNNNLNNINKVNNNTLNNNINKFKIYEQLLKDYNQNQINQNNSNNSNSSNNSNNSNNINHNNNFQSNQNNNNNTNNINNDQLNDIYSPTFYRGNSSSNSNIKPKSKIKINLDLIDNIPPGSLDRYLLKKKVFLPLPKEFKF